MENNKNTTDNSVNAMQRIKEVGIDQFEKEMLESMNIELISKNTHFNVSCGKCGANNVRIYRPYGMFYREEDNRCNDCIDSKHGWLVPCIPSNDEMIWGYSSVPNEDLRWWYSLPEKNPKKPIWDSFHDSWSNSLTKDIYIPEETLNALGKSNFFDDPIAMKKEVSDSDPSAFIAGTRVNTWNWE